jgi:hypothetical protein
MGLDVHEQYTKIQAIDEEGFLAVSNTLPTNAVSLGLFFKILLNLW